MTIGTALVIIAILYLIDRHHLWKKAVVACLIVLTVALIGFSGYYGWQKLQETRAAKAEQEITARTAKDKSIDLSAGLVPDWTVSPPPNGYVSEDVAYAILYPLKTNATVRTDAWVWYRDSWCGVIGAPAQFPDRIGHEHDLFSLESYDARWMKDISLAQEVKRALWSAKVAECRLPPDSKEVRACLDRVTGTVEVDPEWAQYLTGCGPKREMIFLNRGTGGKKWQTDPDVSGIHR